MLNYFYRIKKYFNFDKEEIRGLFFVIFVFTLVLGYDDGFPEFIMSRWIFNLINCFAISSLVVLAKEVGHKLMAIKRGYTVKMKIWYPILLINLFLVFLLDGKIHIMLPVSGLFIFHHERMRIGEFRYGHNYFDNALIAFAGPLTNIYLAAFLNVFSQSLNPIVILAIQVNIIYAVINLIPVDILLFFIQTPRMLERADSRNHPAPFAGTYLFYSTRLFFVFAITCCAILSASIIVSGIFISTLVSIVIGIIVLFVVWWYYDFGVV